MRCKFSHEREREREREREFREREREREKSRLTRRGLFSDVPSEKAKFHKIEVHGAHPLYLVHLVRHWPGHGEENRAYFEHMAVLSSRIALAVLIWSKARVHHPVSETVHFRTARASQPRALTWPKRWRSHTYAHNRDSLLLLLLWLLPSVCLRLLPQRFI